jgi:ketosteroid isomerase-like protein
MSEQENTGLVQLAYGYFQSGDIPTLLGLPSEDVEWLIPGPESVPVTGKWLGREQVGRFFQTLSDTLEVRQFEPREFVAQDEKVVALGHYAWQARSTGREWESDFVHAFTVRGETVTRFQEYTDTAALADAFREG